MHKRVLLIIPCYNEGGGIERLLDEIAQYNYKVVVIDDGSTDNTFEVANKLAPCIRLAHNLGIGGAVQTGIKYAYYNDFDFCIQVDGDGQHPPSQISKLISSYESDHANIVVGSRYITGDTFQSTFARRMGSKVISFVLRFLFGVQITDPTSGFRLMDRKAISFFVKEYPSDFPEPISLAKSLREDLSIREVPVQMREREHGDSSINGLKSFAYMVRVLSYICLVRIGRSQMVEYL